MRLKIAATFGLLGPLFLTTALLAHEPAGPAVTIKSLTVEPTLSNVVGGRSGTQLLITGRDAEGKPIDLTDRAQVSLEPPLAARLEPGGWLTPLKNGPISIVAKYGGQVATTRVDARSTEVVRPIEFRNEVLPSLTRAGCNQGGCHGTPTGKNGFRLSLRGYLPDQDWELLTREFSSRRIDRVHPEASLILTKGTGAVLHQGGQRFTTETPTYQVLRHWISEGCRADSQTSPVLTRIEVTPKERILDLPADSQRLAVRAYFSNGEVRDVTRLARFSSSDEAIARVDVTGRARRVKKGEATILVGFGSLMETARLVFRDAAGPETWTDPPSNNFVDTHLNSKWKLLRLTPSEIADDRTFVRRVYFDVIGLPPSNEEVRRFLAEPARDKRAKLIDTLLERPEYVDFWTLKWADRLGCNQRFTGFKGAYSYHRWIRDQVAANVPFDQFVKSIVTARGGNYTNPPASFYRRIRTPEDAAETVSQLFLGIRIQCARCHNHVAERWTQDDYYGFAAFFSQLKYKDGPQFFELYNKEETVYLQKDAQIRQPRTGKAVSARALGARSAVPADLFDRREALADWIASPSNPFFARATVNRIWFQIFGRGIVDPVDDIRDSNPAASAELLQALADDFVAHKFDVKHTIRLILNTRTYQLSSKPNRSNEDDVKYFTHAQVRLLSAERLLDAITRITEVPEQLFHLPEGTTAAQIPDGEFAHPFLRSFGQPRRSEACECEREADSTLEQALQIIGGRTVHAKIQSPRNRLARLLKSGASNTAIVDDLFEACLSRPPDPEERSIALGSFHDPAEPARRKAAEDLLWSLFNHPEFLFQH